MSSPMGSAGNGRVARLLRLLLLVVVTLALVEYLSGSILDSFPIRTYLYTPLYNATQPTSKSQFRILGPWPKRLRTTTDWSQNPDMINSSHTKNSNITNSVNNDSVKISVNVTNSTKQEEAVTSSVLITKLMDNVNSNINTTEDLMPLCDSMPPDLGPVAVNKSKMDLDEVDKKYPEVQLGGMYVPPNCTARHKVAIIVPFRDRNEHLAIFLNHMHFFLMKQQLEYGIFIVEQSGKQAFNRAKLMNVGFMESQKHKEGGWQCFIFHDVDLLPLDLRNIYNCPKQPRHMSVAVDKLNFKLPYEEIFGGVSAMTVKQFEEVNGFSNKYWGWGGEDDDMFHRLRKKDYHIARYKMSVARYTMLDHKKSKPNPKRYQLLQQTNKTFQKDGLSTLNYHVVETKAHHLYTHILAHISRHS